MFPFMLWINDLCQLDLSLVRCNYLFIWWFPELSDWQQRQSFAHMVTIRTNIWVFSYMCKPICLNGLSEIVRTAYSKPSVDVLYITITFQKFFLGGKF